MGKQIWENFPKKTRLFLRLPFRRHGHCTQMDTGHFQVDRSVSTAKSASMCDHMIVLCLHEQCPGVAYILKAKKFVELPFQSKKKIEGSFFGHFGSFLGHFGPFWAILGHIWATVGHLGSFLGHFVAFVEKFAESSIFSRDLLLECMCTRP